ncbi:MAG: hypothetical protein H5T74_02985 [Actinobacteria bacterium]|nr:hypothetical protein [Actinomycetota bacterium]
MSVELERRLRSLRLSGTAESLSARLLEAERADLSCREFLELLIEDELCVRRDRLYARRLKRTRLQRKNRDAIMGIDLGSSRFRSKYLLK